MRPSAYGEPYPITRRLIEDGRRHLLATDGLDVGVPVRILHGDRDLDVPWEHGLKTFRSLRGADCQFILIGGGDHRLSRDSDIWAIYRAAEELAIKAIPAPPNKSPQALTIGRIDEAIAQFILDAPVGDALRIGIEAPGDRQELGFVERNFRWRRPAHEMGGIGDDILGRTRLVV